MTKACSNRIILALLALGLWVYFVIICLDCQPAIAAIRVRTGMPLCPPMRPCDHVPPRPLPTSPAQPRCPGPRDDPFAALRTLTD